jgi:hypothetical protein
MSATVYAAVFLLSMPLNAYQARLSFFSYLSTLMFGSTVLSCALLQRSC